MTVTVWCQRHSAVFCICKISLNMRKYFSIWITGSGGLESWKKQSLKARDTVPLKYWWWVNLSPDRYFDILQLYTVNPATPWGESTQVRIPGPQAGAQNQWTVHGDFVKKFSCTKIVLVNKLLWWNKYKICNPFNSFGEEIL